MSAVDIAIPRIAAAEGFRADVYDDATGRSLETLGQPTVGYGCRVRQWSLPLAQAVLRLQLDQIDGLLSGQAWYADNDARRSVLLEIAFNQGLAGLNGYPRLLAAAARRDWVQAAIECSVRNPALKTRYARLAKILVTGEIE